MKTKVYLISIFALFTTLFFVLNSCKKDPCKDTVCYNGGYCDDGTCICPQGYTGSDCNTQLTPTRIKINSIKITKFPQYDGSSNWDFSDGPDIYITMSLDGTVIHEQPSMFEDASVTTSYLYEPTSPIVLTNIGAQYSIRLYDYDDGLGDDYMGGILFYPYSSTSGFPTTLYIDAGENVAFEFSVSYEW